MHRTWSYNEFSNRYSKSKLEFYCPPEMQYILQPVYDKAEETYNHLLNTSNKETARFVLPVATFTYFRGKTNFRNLIAFLRLRTAPDVQPETRQIALQMVDLLRERMPELMEVCWDG